MRGLTPRTLAASCKDRRLELANFVNTALHPQSLNVIGLPVISRTHTHMPRHVAYYISSAGVWNVECRRLRNKKICLLGDSNELQLPGEGKHIAKLGVLMLDNPLCVQTFAWQIFHGSENQIKKTCGHWALPLRDVGYKELQECLGSLPKTERKRQQIHALVGNWAKDE